MALSRIKHTLDHVANVSNKLASAESEMVQIEKFRRERVQDMRQATQKELSIVATRKMLEAVGLSVDLQGQQQLLAERRADLCLIEAKIDALQQLVDEILAAIDNDHDE